MNLGHASPTAHPRAVGILNRIGEFFYERAPDPPDPRLVAALEHVVDTAIAKREGVAVTQPIGASGIVSTGGYVQTSERSADLVGTTRQQKFEEWKRLLAQIGGAYRIYLVLIGSPTWSLPPWKASKDTDPTPEDEERAAWALNQLLNLGEDGLERLVMELSIAFWDGLAVGAWTAKAMPPGDLAAFGLADVLKLPLSTIERYDLDPQGRVLGIVQRDPNTGVEIAIPRERLVWQRDLPTTTNPAGDGAMRFLAESVRRLLALETLFDKGVEADVNGVPIIYAPIIEMRAQIGQPKSNGQPYTQADFDADLAYAYTFIDAKKRKNAGLVLDSSTVPNPDGTPSNVRRFTAEVISAQSSSQDVLLKRMRQLAWDMRALIGFEFQSLGEDGAGSLAMHESKWGVTLYVLSAVLNGIAKTIKRDLLRPLWILNGWDPKNPTDPQNVPTPAWDALEFADVGKVASAISAMLTADGTAPGRADHVVDRILENLGFPPLKEEDPEMAAMARDQALTAAGLGKPDPNALDAQET